MDEAVLNTDSASVEPTNTGWEKTEFGSSMEELIMKEGRRQDGEVSVKLTDEQIKEKHDKFHEIYREQVLDTIEFGELRKQFNARKKLRETDMAKLDNCLVRGEETQCVTRWRIAAHKLKAFWTTAENDDTAELAFVFDSDFNLIDRVPLTEMERQMQIEYEDSTSTTVQDDVAEVLIDGSSEEDVPKEGFFEAPEHSPFGVAEDSDSAQVLLDRALGNGSGRRNVNYQPV